MKDNINGKGHMTKMATMAINSPLQILFQTSHFILHTSQFILLTSHFTVQTSNFTVHTHRLKRRYISNNDVTSQRETPDDA